MKNKRRVETGYGVITLIVLCVMRVSAQNVSIDTLVLNGPTDNRLNIVFLADGFQENEFDEFADWALQAYRDVFHETWNAIPVYHQYENMFNSFVIRTPSGESGITTYEKNTFYECYLPNGGWSTGRCNRSKALETAEEYFPEFDALILVFNASDRQHRATGGQPVYVPYDVGMEVIQHELGHNIADLLDEYEEAGRTGNCKESPNTTDETSRNYIKWNHWIDADTPIPTPDISTYSEEVGLFEGANYMDEGCYRPQRNCLMRSYSGMGSGNMVTYCKVCKEAMLLAQYDKIFPIDGKSPDSNHVVLQEGAQKTFGVDAVLDERETVDYLWELDGEDIAGATGSSYTLQGLLPGDYQLRVTVRDNTEDVRTNLSLLSDNAVWDITVEPTLGIKRPSDGPFIATGGITRGILTYSVYQSSQFEFSIHNLRGERMAPTVIKFNNPGRYQYQPDMPSAGEVFILRLKAYRLENTGEFIHRDFKIIRH